MADYKQRLENLRHRRLGLDDRSRAFDSMAAATGAYYSFAESLYKSEAYEQRSNQNAVKYALGAMQEVDPAYTRISIEEGDKVKSQLSAGLKASDIAVTFDYQGSVPLNVHIRGVSDIDLLVLHDEFVTLDWNGPKANKYTPLGCSALGDMLKLRSSSEKILENKFPTANINKGGAKSISISGGTLRRKVDVVPSHWHDTSDFQKSGGKHDREIMVLDKTIPATIANRPFMHMKCINEKDSAVSGCVKKIIRLLKNVCNDADSDIKLTSYDIASLVWNFASAKFNQQKQFELRLIAITQTELWTLICDRPRAESLDVPDKSRKIINSSEKFDSLVLLSKELDQLATDIARELNPFNNLIGVEGVLSRLNESIIY